MKPLRAALFAPGNSPDRAEKAHGLNADAVFIAVLGYNKSQEMREAMGPKARQNPESVPREYKGNTRHKFNSELSLGCSCRKCLVDPKHPLGTLNDGQVKQLTAERYSTIASGDSRVEGSNDAGRIVDFGC